MTSTLSIAEVAFAVREGEVIPEEEMDALWEDPGVQLVEYSRLVAREARTLVRRGRQAGWKLKPPDAIQIASAKRAHAVELHTYDGNLLKLPQEVGITIIEPYAEQERMPLDL